MAGVRLPGRVGREWLRPTDKPVDLVITSRPEAWVAHWDSHFRKFRRCGGTVCGFCAVGVERILKIVVLSVGASGRCFYVEFRETHRAVIQAMLEAGGAQGCTIRVQRDGTAQNAPIGIRWLDRPRVRVKDTSVKAIVDRMGLPAAGVDGEEVASLFSVEELLATEPTGYEAAVASLQAAGDDVAQPRAEVKPKRGRPRTSAGRKTDQAVRVSDVVGSSSGGCPEENDPLDRLLLAEVQGRAAARGYVEADDPDEVIGFAAAAVEAFRLAEDGRGKMAATSLEEDLADLARRRTERLRVLRGEAA